LAIQRNWHHRVHETKKTSLVDVFFNRPMGTNCATLLADLFLYSYEADFIQGLLQKHEKKLGRSFNFKFRYIYVTQIFNNGQPSHSDNLKIFEVTKRNP
jgi:hypothetical protein